MLPLPPLESNRALVGEIESVHPNVAVTFLALFIVTVHCTPFVESHPDQLASENPKSGVAVSVTTVAALYEKLQVVPQFMPAGELATVPVPVPDFVTVRLYEYEGSRSKVAVTFFAAFIVTVHWFPFVLSQPLQAVKFDPGLGVAVNVTGTFIT
jgi:hypothetical protein